MIWLPARLPELAALTWESCLAQELSTDSLRVTRIALWRPPCRAVTPKKNTMRTLPRFPEQHGLCLLYTSRCV